MVYLELASETRENDDDGRKTDRDALDAAGKVRDDADVWRCAPERSH